MVGTDASVEAGLDQERASLSLTRQWRKSGYWRRTLSYFLIGERDDLVMITLIDRNGVVGDWTGQVLATTDDGPIVNWKRQGQPALLCTWEQLRAIERVSWKGRMLWRLMQVSRRRL